MVIESGMFIEEPGWMQRPWYIRSTEKHSVVFLLLTPVFFSQGPQFRFSLFQLQGIFSKYFSKVLSPFRKTNLKLIPVKGEVFFEDLQPATRK